MPDLFSTMTIVSIITFNLHSFKTPTPLNASFLKVKSKLQVNFESVIKNFKHVSICFTASSVSNLVSFSAHLTSGNKKSHIVLRPVDVLVLLKRNNKIPDNCFRVI